MEAGAEGRVDTPSSPRRSRTTSPEQRAALRKQKEERQRRARRRRQQLPDEPAAAQAKPAAGSDASMQPESERTRAAEREAAADAPDSSARALKEQLRAEHEELATPEAIVEAAQVAEDRAVAQRAAEARRLADEEEAAAAAAAAAATAEKSIAGDTTLETARTSPNVELMQPADASHTGGRDSASPAVVVLNVPKGSAGFTCAENLTVIKLPPGKKGSQAEAAGVTIGMHCVAFQGVALDSTATWSSLKDLVKNSPRPWSFTFSASADEADDAVKPEQPGAEAGHSVRTHGEEPEPFSQYHTTVEMTSSTRSMIEEGWQQPNWVSPSRNTPTAKPSAPTKPAELQGVEPAPDYIVAAWTMPSDEPLALDFEVQVMKKKRGSSMMVVARQHMTVNHNERWMVRQWHAPFLYILVP